MDFSIVDEPVSVVASGIVTTSNEVGRPLIQCARHTIYLGRSAVDFVICCRTDLNPKWSLRTSSQLLSKPRSTVAFTGAILHFRDHHFAITQRAFLCVVVDFHHIAFIKERVANQPTPAPPHNLDLGAKLKSPMLQRKQQRTSASSSKALGKPIPRKRSTVPYVLSNKKKVFLCPFTRTRPCLPLLCFHLCFSIT